FLIPLKSPSHARNFQHTRSCETQDFWNKPKALITFRFSVPHFCSRMGTRTGEPAMKDLSAPEYDAILRLDFWFFAQRCFCQLNPQTTLATNWHLEVIAAKLTGVREGKIRRLIINVAPRNLKSLLASIAFPAWCLGHDPSA